MGRMKTSSSRFGFREHLIGALFGLPFAALFLVYGWAVGY